MLKRSHWMPLVRSNIFILAVFAGLSLASAAATTAGGDFAAGAHEDVVFDRPSPLAGSVELQRRLLSPLMARAVQQRVAANGNMLSEQSIDLAHEHFAYYVPRGEMPAAGFALLVFVPPWERAELPRSWFGVLDRHATILVTAAKSGNDENFIGRRIPLALSAYENIAKRFRIDPSRTYVGGLSGGSRVALRIALGYPDVFRGALLNAGSDRFGAPELPFPPSPLLQRFEEGTRLVYATGTRDESHIQTDQASRASAREFCITNVRELPMHGVGHVLIDAGTLDHALSALEAGYSTPADVDACHARRAQAIAENIARIETLLSRGDIRGAAAQLATLDAHVGALASPQSVELASRIEQAKGEGATQQTVAH